ncbi:hypothetical protein J5N97_006227 [Dioscorea zingiberensis]|uniref:Uncharacterized protein n=1 Tax=Dioscorea zingiberensis TaxID=325984 RepID=A0A9D5HTG6_9LILI|nr:hypothetical protein J5N97_006227 [Dioscorea zingiberensis]
MDIHAGLLPQARGRSCVLRRVISNNDRSVRRIRVLFFGAAGSSRLCSNNGREERFRLVMSSSLSSGFEGLPGDEQVEEIIRRIQWFRSAGEEAHDWWRLRKQAEFPESEYSEYCELERAKMDEMMMASTVDRNANRQGLPLSLRIIKRKKRWERELMEAGEFACCSAKRAFSSMVFIIRELQSHALFWDDQVPLPGILDRVRSDLHASFVWLFQRVFCCTPTLMLYLMILLANFSVYSMVRNPAIAMPPCPSLLVSLSDVNHDHHHHKSIISDPWGSKLQDEQTAWEKIVEYALRMRARTRDESLMDPEVLRQLVAPVTARIQAEEDNCEHYIHTELMYERVLSEDPDNALLLSNFAQFLYLVHRNYDSRAEYYFKRAVKIQPADAEALNRYACFLWLVRKDLGTAEETFLEAIAADPDNLVYASNYSHFIWKTGGKGTCFPILDNPDAY